MKLPPHAASRAALPQLLVPPDHFDVLCDDGWLTAQLHAAVAVCLYDAVEESGALVHLRLMPDRHGGDGPLGDVLLLEACTKQLRAASPQSRHWQARVLAHLGSDGSRRREAESVVQSISQFCLDSRVRLVGSEQQLGLSVTLRFRPSMGQYRLSL